MKTSAISKGGKRRMDPNTYQQLIQQIPVGVALFQLYDNEQEYFHGIKIIEINESFTEATGLTQQEIMQQQESQLVGSESSPYHIVLSCFEEIIKQSPMSNHVFHYQSLNRYFRVNSSVLENQQVVLFIDDISQHIEDRDEKMAIIMTLNDIVFELDENSIITNVYTADESQLFYPKSEIIGFKSERLFPNDLSHNLLYSRIMAKQTGQKQTVIYPSIIPGEKRWYKAESQFVSINQVNRFLVRVSDITQEKNVQNTLDEALNQLNRFFDVNVDMLCIVDSTGKFVKLNQAWEIMTGYLISELEGRNYIDFVHPEDIEETLAVSKKLIEEQKLQIFVNRYVTKNNDIRSIEWRAQTSEGMIFASARDITEQLAMQQEILLQKEQYELAIKGTNDGIWDWNLKTNELFISAIWKEMLGYENHELENKPESFVNNLHPDDKSMVFSKIKQYLEQEISEYNLEFRMIHKNGNSVWIQARGEAVFDMNGIPYRMAGSHKDITEEKRIKDQLMQTNQRFKDISKNGRIISWEVDKNGLYTYVSDVCADVFGYNTDEMQDKMYFYDLHPLASRDKFKQKAFEVFAQKRPFSNFLNQAETKEGKSVWVYTHGIPRLDEQGELIGYSGFDIDVTKIHNIEEELRLSEERYQILTANITDVLWLYNYDQLRFVYFSPSIKQLIGYTAEEVMDLALEDFITTESTDALIEQIEKATKDFEIDPNLAITFNNEIEMINKNGQLIWTEYNATLRYNEKKEIEIIGVNRNIDKRKEFEKEIVYLSFHDQLTGLYNRRFYEVESKRLNTARNLPISLVMADVNGLKLTNDAFGHLAGDRLLLQFAEILKNEFRDDDIISRVGGDEFIILLPKTDYRSAQKIVDRVIEAINHSVPETIRLSAAFGIATSEEVVDSFNEFYKKAEDAMYSQKISLGEDYKKETLHLITESLYKKFPDQQRHSEKVKVLCERIAIALKLSSQEVEDIALSGLLHDVGKIGLDYLDDLSSEMKNHPIIGYQILRSVSEFQGISENILAHHESIDGTGYPKGLKGNQIPLAAKIIRIANEFDWLVSQSNNNIEEVIEQLKAMANSQLDSSILKIFLEDVLRKD